MRKVIEFLAKFLSDENTQKMLLNVAARLAKKTDFEWDDELVSAFRKWSGK